MALLPSTQETRMVPVAGRQFAERRKIRGVGAAERAVGNAWGRLDSRQRGAIGSQRNFARRLQRTADARAVAQEASQEEADRDRGRQDAINEGADPIPSRLETPLTPYRPINHAETVLAKSLRKARLGKSIPMSQSGQDR